MGIKLLPPDVNESNASVHGRGRRDPLRPRRDQGRRRVARRGARRRAALAAARSARSSTSASASGTQSLNKGVLEALVGAGAMDRLPGNRAQKLAVARGRAHDRRLRRAGPEERPDLALRRRSTARMPPDANAAALPDLPELAEGRPAPAREGRARLLPDRPSAQPRAGRAPALGHVRDQEARRPHRPRARHRSAASSAPCARGRPRTARLGLEDGGGRARGHDRRHRGARPAEALPRSRRSARGGPHRLHQGRGELVEGAAERPALGADRLRRRADRPLLPRRRPPRRRRRARDAARRGEGRRPRPRRVPLPSSSS